MALKGRVSDLSEANADGLSIQLSCNNAKDYRYFGGPDLGAVFVDLLLVQSDSGFCEHVECSCRAPLLEVSLER